MLEVNEIMERIRARLKDVDYSNLRFSNQEILDVLNNLVASLILEFKLNKAQVSGALSAQTPKLYAPYLLGIQSASLNNTPLAQSVFCSLEPAESPALLIEGDYLSVTPFTPGFLRVVYLSYMPIEELEESLPLPSLALNCVVYGCLAQMLEVPTDENNPLKINLFKSLFKEAKDVLRLYLNNLNPACAHSKVIRV